MTADTETAIITGLFTLTGAAMGAVGSLWLERSKAKYEDRNAEVQARRTYRFDALKNLYVHVDPLLFRLQEPLETIVGHVTGVAREARAHRLLAPGGWHAADTYNLRAFVYRLAAPGAYYHLMQRSLSTVDLGLDPSTRTIYELMRAYVRLFRYDFRFADDIYGKDAAGADRYRPDRTADMLPAPGAQGAHFPQGIVLGLLDPMLDQLIVGKQERISSFGEIEIAYRNADAKTVEAMRPLAAIVAGFTPEDRPVFWAIVLAQVIVAKLVLRLIGQRVSGADAKALDVESAAREIIGSAAFRQAYLDGIDVPGAVVRALPGRIAAAMRSSA